MKKIININFHSRVIPIEETAYEILQQYVDSLRRYFANEEGRDEIISDIENRFSELFADKLKKGAACITDEDVNAIIASMGRPEEFDGEPAETASQPGQGTGSAGAGFAGGAGASAGAGTSGAAGASGGTGTSGGTGGFGSTGTFSGAGTSGAAGASQGYGTYGPDEPRRLYRASNDKVLGGVCAGLANYLKLDPVVVRLLFVLITFTWGFGFLLYIVLWAVLPTRTLGASARKRLYRNPDDRVIAGVASGLAAYFHIDVWIPRLIFALPMILGIVTSIFSNIWWHAFRHSGGHFIFDGFGGSLFVAYVVLWIVLPEATTASDKLEMRGEKINLESIKNTVKSDLESVKGRAKEMGAEFSERMQQMGREMGGQVRQNIQNVSSEVGYNMRKSGTGIGHAIGVLFKAFFLCIAGLIAFGLIMALVALAFSAGGFMDLKNYFYNGFWENILTWLSFLLILVIPVVALLTWLIRRITGMRSQRHYLGYVFATLWIIGVICFISLVFIVTRDFKSRSHIEDEFAMAQPSHGSLIIKTRVVNHPVAYDDEDWWWFGDNSWRRSWRHNSAFFMLNDDSVELNTVQIKVLRSEDSSYHLRVLRGSLGSSKSGALARAQQISFPVAQYDSVIQLPEGFSITREQKWRNQQVIIAVYVPVGKKILMDNSTKRYDWKTFTVNRGNINWDDDRTDYGDDIDGEGFSFQNNYHWNSGVQYMMTADGLQPVNPGDGDHPERLERPEHPEKKEKPESPDRQSQPDHHGGYRYQAPAKTGKDSAAPKTTTGIAPTANGRAIRATTWSAPTTNGRALRATTLATTRRQSPYVLLPYLL